MLFLRLAVTPEQAKRLNRLPIVRASAIPSRKSRRHRAVLWDTPDGDLRRRGITLAVHRDGAGWRQSVSLFATPSGVEGLDAATLSPVLGRRFEAPAESAAPDIAGFASTPLAGFLDPDELAAAIEAGAVAEVPETIIPLNREDARLDLILRENGSGVPQEVELLGREGGSAPLFDFALALHAETPFNLLRLAPGEADVEVSEVVVPDMSAADAFQALILAGLGRLRRQEGRILDGGDPEAIHQARVAVRQLRALIGLFRPVIDETVHEGLADDLGWLQSALGPARDLDVFLESTLGPITAKQPDMPGLGDLATAARDARAVAYAEAGRALAGERYTRFLLTTARDLESGAWMAADASDVLAAPVEAFADDALDRRARQLRKRGRKHRRLDDADLHRVRIAAKKLRYATEFFQPLYAAKPARRFVKRVKAIQETLGTLNDAVVGQHVVDGLTADMSPGLAGSAAVTGAAGLVKGWLLGRSEGDRERFGAAWKAYRRADRFWETT